MSELPEIKIITRRIANATIGKEIVAFTVSNFKLLGGEQVDFEQAIIGSHFKFIEVCGESILFKLASSYYLLANMQSTGFFHYVLASDLSNFDHKNIKAEFIFEDGSKLFFINSKGYSYFKLLTDDRLKRERLKFGLDPLAEEFTYATFVDLLSNKTASIKKILTDEKNIFGLGKVYSDEILFESRVYPAKSVSELDTPEVKRLFKAITKILNKALEYDGLSFYLSLSDKTVRFDHFVAVYNKAGEICSHCRARQIEHDKTGEVDFFFCPGCQENM